VTQGGSDTHGLTPKIVRALDGIAEDPAMTIVVGPAYRHHVELEAALRDHRLHVDVRRNVADMTPLMLDADLAITAGGITMLELACVGTPMIAVCGDWFEEETAARVAAAGAALNLGFGGAVTEDDISRAVDVLAADADRRSRMSEAGKRLVDGRGAARLAALVRSARREAVGL
jgi:spore coat polysaccharide biosynthesis predicted glycosyltransferase SpsG